MPFPCSFRFWSQNSPMKGCQPRRLHFFPEDCTSFYMHMSKNNFYGMASLLVGEKDESKLNKV